MEADLGHGGTDMRAEPAVHCFPDLIVIGKGKADRIDRGDRHQGRDHERGGREEVQRAVAHLGEHVGVAAELVVREDGDLDPAIALLGDAVGGFLGADVEGMRQRQVVAVFQRELGRPGRARETAHQARGGEDGQGLQGAPTGQGHGLLLQQRFDVI